MTKGKASKIDKIVGRNILSMRLARGLSRNTVSSEIGVSSQQLVKYEQGVNRISAGTLLLVAKILKVTIEDFYLEHISQEERDIFDNYKIRKMEVAAMTGHLYRIKDSVLQKAFFELIKAIGK